MIMEESNSNHDNNRDNKDNNKNEKDIIFIATIEEWQDPLLLTNVSWQQQQQQNPSSSLYSDSLTMGDRVYSSFNKTDDGCEGRSLLGFSLTSPDLVVCDGSPVIPRNGYGDSPEIEDKNRYSVEVSLENGIDGPDFCDRRVTRSVRFSDFSRELSPESSFELLPQHEKSDNLLKEQQPAGIFINVGCKDKDVVFCGEKFLGDHCFAGGDTVRTNVMIGDGEGEEHGHSLFQTARFGNFSYSFDSLERGNYVVSLHFAEIVFTNGPSGLRMFDVYIQEKKVVSSLDIYNQVGANRPLVVSDSKTCVDGENGLSIRFEGVMGSPILCGISVVKDSNANVEEAPMLKAVGITEATKYESPNENGECKVEGSYRRLLEDYECQKRELEDMRRALEELKRDNQLKTRECQEAWKSLQDLQNELMRKSMHVGSLAFAIEGQVKEKSKWFSSLRDLNRKLKIMKMEQIKLSEEAAAYKQCLAADMSKISSTIQSKMEEQVALHEDMKIKFLQGAKERKDLYNRVLELKGNIRVFCRCRPLNNEEIASGASMAIDFESAKDGELTVISNGLPKKTFKFDAVFTPQTDQAVVFEDTAPFAASVLDGYNVCIFAYGQTGTGKTFTMEGTEEARGVNFRILEEMFRIIKERQKLIRYDISVSVVEVYNEQIRDLLASTHQPGAAAKRLEIRQVGEGVHHVLGLVEARVNNASQVWEVIQTGSNARAVGSTNANEHSSRSHCVHCVTVKGESLLNGECTKSKLWLVDLAGSERVAKTEVQGDRLKEAQNINRSLSALGDVISALATKSPHIPFRNSKLTHLLQDSLGGDSKTLMFLQISPNENDLSETLCSLSFASRVRGIELGPAKRQLDNNNELVRFKHMAEKSKQDMKSKDVQIRKMEETIHGLELKTKDKDLKNKNLQDKVKELESQLLVERKLARQHVDTKILEQKQQQQLKLQHDDQNSTSAVRPPLTYRLLGGTNKNFNEPARSAASNKEQVNVIQPLLQSNCYKTLTNLPSKDNSEKENNPEMAEQPQPLLPKRAGRYSICPPRQTPLTVLPRRNSLIPIPTAIGLAQQLPSPLPPLSFFKAEDIEEEPEANCFPEQTSCDTPKANRNCTKKISSNILRRSLHKRVINMKSPLQQQLRKGGINVGMEKVRVSIGSRGRMAHRVLLGNGRRVSIKEAQQKLSQKEKERGWNIGAAGRTAI